MFKIICVTNRSLCKENFLVRINRIAQASPEAIILREKDLTEHEYYILAKDVIEICDRYKIQCILHNFITVALDLNHSAIHLPYSKLKDLSENEKKQFKILGASCHSIDDALYAQKKGCTYITAGHIFETDCKKGLPGRGLDFLENICNQIDIPVYAIGGISQKNISRIKNTGASGACIMSGFMCGENINELIEME